MAQTQRIYNAGDRIFEKMLIDNPIGHDNACKSYYTVDIPPREFAEVPREVYVAGHQVVADVLAFIQTRHSWVVLVDKNRTEIGDAEAVATNDKDAMAKANESWTNHLKASAQEHIRMCQEMRRRNLSPPAAIGFAKRALESLGLKDPAIDEVLSVQKNDTVDALKKQIEDLTKLVMQGQPQTKGAKA